VLSKNARQEIMGPSLRDFDYPLRPELIAQEPPPERGSSRLLVLDRASGRLGHHAFAALPDLLRPGDLLVLNETRVFAARLRARRQGGGKAELLLLEPAGDGAAWKALAKPGKAFRPEAVLDLEGAQATVHALGRDGATALVEIRRGGRPLAREEVLDLCAEAGEMPVPPYVRRQPGDSRLDLDRGRYQTVYARETGAVAAPTAGLHFTAGLLERLEAAGVESARLTLHVGLGTFQPLSEEAFAGSTLPSERLELGAAAGRAVRRARSEGRRIVAVGTTCVRGLESFGLEKDDGPLPFSARATLFIKPGYTFRSVGALITNFHLPMSSPLVLVSAFAGRERLLAAYAEAAREGYRFYSYGDAMLVL
jgi:S-adenosylmethionine:tRNA ribosyltransferase-isomerase